MGKDLARRFNYGVHLRGIFICTDYNSQKKQVDWHAITSTGILNHSKKGRFLYGRGPDCHYGL